jgi:hypothetical protein
MCKTYQTPQLLESRQYDSLTKNAKKIVFLIGYKDTHIIFITN